MASLATRVSARRGSAGPSVGDFTDDEGSAELVGDVQGMVAEKLLFPLAPIIATCWLSPQTALPTKDT